MRKRLGCGLLVLVASLTCLPAAGAEQGTSFIARVSWLAGCWESARGDRRTEEQWMTPRGGTMIGMSRTVTGERTSGIEFMRIQEEGGRLVFTARPSGQDEASFGSIELTKSRVVFENRLHDFPQRVIYSLDRDGSLLARIEGEREGALQGVDFPMNRTTCAANAGR